MIIDFPRSITPMLAFPKAGAAIDWYREAFGAVELMRLEADGVVGHAEMRIAGALVMLADEHARYNRSPATLGGTSAIFHLYVDDVDAFADRAVAAGAKVIFLVEDQDYGDRAGRLEDPFGYQWAVATPQRTVPAAEMQAQYEAWLTVHPEGRPDSSRQES
ncbi:MAG TPA: VOC family protein [bacterium]|nr:VOC family protein [bacterium]